jgi:hypothetical protein
MLFDLSIALQLRHDLSKVAVPTPRSGLVRHGYPWVPTNQSHGRPRQVGPAYQKTRRRVSGPNRPSWRPTRSPKDLPENSPNDLIQHGLKTWRTRQDLGGFRLEQIDTIWQAM